MFSFDALVRGNGQECAVMIFSFNILIDNSKTNFTVGSNYYFFDLTTNRLEN